MAKAKNKTTKTEGSVSEYISAIAQDTKREDCEHILKLMSEISGYTPKMWGASIVGFGEYHYKYDSGREGDAIRIGFAARAQTIAIYLMPGYENFEDELSRLGKHKMGKSCLNIKRLVDVDTDVLKEMLVKNLSIMAEKYPDGA